MANKRMFSRDVVEHDDFLELSKGAKVLYFYLNLAADNEGFVNNKRTITRMCDCSENDLQELIDGNWIIPFGTGVLVITHWRIHNTLKNDRCNSAHKAEKSCLKCVENIYYLCEKGAPGNILETSWKRSGNKLETNWSIEKEEEERKRGKEKEEEEEHEQEGEKEGEAMEGEKKINQPSVVDNYDIKTIPVELPVEIYEAATQKYNKADGGVNDCILYYQTLVGGKVFPNYQKDIDIIVRQYGAYTFITAISILKAHNLDYSIKNIEAICQAAAYGERYANIVCKTQK